MSQITRDALLLGMKHHGFVFPAGALVPSEAIALRRDPHNQHDPNAIAVLISGVMAGFIDKQNAQIIAPLLDKGAKVSVGAIAKGPTVRTSVPLKIVLEQNFQAIPPPKLAAGKVIGIYLIEIEHCSEVYIGQSRDINERIKSHWRELNHGVHSNPELRRLWERYGGHTFKARIIDVAPTECTDQKLSAWLQDRELHWISHYDELVGVYNFDTPQMILTGEDRLLERKRRLAEKELRKAGAEKIKAIKTKMDCVWKRKYDLVDKIEEASRLISRTRGIKGFLFATAEEKTKAGAMETVITRLKDEVSALDSIYAQMTREVDELEAHLPSKSQSKRLSRKRR